MAKLDAPAKDFPIKSKPILASMSALGAHGRAPVHRDAISLHGPYQIGSCPIWAGDGQVPQKLRAEEV